MPRATPFKQNMRREAIQKVAVCSTMYSLISGYRGAAASYVGSPGIHAACARNGCYCPAGQYNILCNVVKNSHIW